MKIDYEVLLPRIAASVKKGDMGAATDALEVLRSYEKEGSVTVLSQKANRDDTLIYEPTNFQNAHDWSKKLRAAVIAAGKKGMDNKALEVYKKYLLFDAPHDFDSYCVYIEWGRETKRQFYMPRRKQLYPMVKEMQRLATGDLEILAISTPPGIGKTTLAIFYLTWISGRNPELTVLGGSHSNSFLRGVYEEVLRIIDPKGEYLFRDVFPHAKLASTNSKDLRIDLGARKRFETLEFSSIGSGNAGKVRASNLLYCDDLIDGIETAMSRDRLDKLYQQYYTDLRQRKIGNCRELHIATRWSTWDVISRLERQYAGESRAEFLTFPAVDENDESLWDYPYNLGFTTQFFQEQRRIMDDASWRALYMNSPIERNGLLYSPDELRRYFDLPDGEPDAVVAVCDIADGGGDYWTVPIAYQYGNDFYIEYFICDNGKPEVVMERIARALTDKGVKLARFESNRAGGRAAVSVQERVKELGGTTKITTKWNQTNKETRLIVDAPWVKERCLFRDESRYREDKEYKTAMQFLTSYTMSGKNKHDDVPDALSQLANFVQSFAGTRIKISRRPF